MRNSLRNVGFEVTMVRDASMLKMRKAIDIDSRVNVPPMAAFGT